MPGLEQACQRCQDVVGYRSVCPAGHSRVWPNYRTAPDERFRSVLGIRLDRLRDFFPLREQLPELALARIKQATDTLRFLDAYEVT
jgi:hypothetical protein